MVQEQFSRIDAILAKLQVILSGEPLRALGYTLGLVIFVAAKVSGAIPDVSLDQAFLQAAGALTVAVTLIESARRLVYSPRTVEKIEDKAFTEGARAGAAIVRTAPSDVASPGIDEPVAAPSDARIDATPEADTL